METYIDRIKLMKNQKKLTNERLSELSGVPLGTLSKLLAGMNESPKLSNIVAICSALDCSVEYIVTGAPDNTNNYTLEPEEISLVEMYRRLDSWGKSVATVVIAKERERVLGTESVSVAPAVPAPAKILRPQMPQGSVGRFAGERIVKGKRSIRLYELPVSAGVGVYLDDARSEKISIPGNEKTAEADYALRISGNSMEPKYHDGDILLVQNADGVEIGEMGIFLLDGSGFFKVFDGDRLLSLNPEYGPILLKDFSDVQCRGRVVGKLRRKSSAKADSGAEADNND